MDNTHKRAILVTIAHTQRDVLSCEKSLDELARLLDTAGGEEFARMIQVKESFDPRTCIGSGKVEELKTLVENNDISLVIFDFELSPAQIRNLEDALGDVSVIDRCMLILDIFAAHAVTSEGKLQVELAQLRYTAPRLVGKGKDLSRLGGGIGTRGPGESQLERDKRHLKERIRALERQLEEVVHNRGIMRASRDRSGITKVAIVGYTNAGKSTLLNALTDAGVLCEDKLFATLDPTTRRLTLPNDESILLTDTVGFINNLPHQLVKAFRSTLEEAAYADIILILVNISDEEHETHIAVTQELLEELGAGNKPTLLVYNQCDQLAEFPKTGIRREKDQVYISAKEGWGLDLLLEALGELAHAGKKRCTLYFPYSEQAKVSALYQDASVESIEYTDTCVAVVAVLDEKSQGKYAEFMGEV